LAVVAAAVVVVDRIGFIGVALVVVVVVVGTEPLFTTTEDDFFFAPLLIPLLSTSFEARLRLRLRKLNMDTMVFVLRLD
jgi:hypothetical protein